MLRKDFLVNEQKTPFIESILLSFYAQEMVITNEVVKSDVERFFYTKKLGTSQTPLIATIYLDDSSKRIRGIILYQKDKNIFSLLKEGSKNSGRFSIVDKNAIIGSLQHKFEKGIKVSLLKDMLFNLDQSYYQYIGLYLPELKEKEQRSVYELSFDKPCMFSISVLDSIHKDNYESIYIANFNDIDVGEYLFDINNMKKDGHVRNDVFCLDTLTGRLTDFIITFFKRVNQNSYLPIFYLFEVDENGDYKFTKRSPCFAELKQITDSKNQNESNIAFTEKVSRYTYEGYLLINEAKRELAVVEELEEFEEQVVGEETIVLPTLDPEFESYITKLGGIIEGTNIFFPEFESFPFASFANGEISIRTSRHSNDTYLYPYSPHAFKTKQKEIQNRLYRLLMEHTPSRLHTIKVLLERVNGKNFNKDDNELINSFNYEIAMSFSSLWGTDFTYFSSLVAKLHSQYENWQTSNGLKAVSINQETETESLFVDEVITSKKRKTYNDKSLYLLGAIAGRVTKIYEEAELYGFKRKNVHVFEYNELTNFDYNSLMNEKHIKGSFVILGQGPHSVVGKGHYDSAIDMFKGEKELLPVFDICEYNNSGKSLAPISVSRLTKAFENFKLEKVNQ